MKNIFNLLSWKKSTKITTVLALALILVPAVALALSGTGAANRVAVWTGTDTVSYDDNLVWDGVNNNFIIGSSTALYNEILGVYTTGTPAKLIVDRTDGATFEMIAKTSNIKLGARSDHGLEFTVNSIPQFYISNSSQNYNVGIGTATPAEKLDVAGNIKLTGSIVSDGDICLGNCLP